MTQKSCFLSSCKHGGIKSGIFILSYHSEPRIEICESLLMDCGNYIKNDFYTKQDTETSQVSSVPLIQPCL